MTALTQGKDAGAAQLARSRVAPITLLGITLQLMLVLVLLRQFQIESAAFRLVAALAVGAFVVHALLPLRFRMAFFSAVSLLSIPLTLGLVNGIWLIAIGAVLIVTCHLPIAIRWRAALLLALGALLIAQRSRLLPAPWSEAIWPILGSMFMFRLIAYFYDLRHDSVPVTRAQSVSYFFMLPNACFPLFPVVDFKTYRRSHFSSAADATYQRGAWTLHALRLTVGDVVFFKILRAYYQRFAGSHASTADFIATAVEVSGQPAVELLLRDWLTGPNLPAQPAP